MNNMEASAVACFHILLRNVKRCGDRIFDVHFLPVPSVLPRPSSWQSATCQKL